MKPIPENLAQEAAVAIAPLAFRSVDSVRAFLSMRGPLEWRGDCVPLARFQEAWTDRVFLLGAETRLPRGETFGRAALFPAVRRKAGELRCFHRRLNMKKSDLVSTALFLLVALGGLLAAAVGALFG